MNTIIIDLGFHYPLVSVYGKVIFYFSYVKVGPKNSFDINLKRLLATVSHAGILSVHPAGICREVDCFPP